MKAKSKIKKFFTLNPRAHDGFTLVELIVVIAILAILAGVGTAGYSGYITAANKGNDKVLVGNVVRALETYNNSAMGSFAVEGQYEAGLQIPVGYVILTYDETTEGRYVTIVTPGTSETPDATVNTAGVLEDAIEAAFGSDYAQTVKLTYDGWSGELNGLFFENASQMIGKVDQTGDNVLTLLNDLGKMNLIGSGLYYENGKLSLKIFGYTVKSVPIISKGYTNSAELLLDLSKKVAAVDKNEFITAWNGANAEGDAFGVNLVEGAGREHYSAVRAAYNSCFANFVRSKGATFTVDDTVYTHTHYSDHATAIENHGQDAIELVKDNLGDIGEYLGDYQTGTTFPQVVCDTVLQGGTEDSDSYTTCAACKALLTEYKRSEQDKTDAESFYDTMTTGATEGDAHYDPNNPDSFFIWMTDSADVFGDMYTTANQYTSGSSVSLSIYYNTTTGLLDISVSPAEADPRND